MKPHGINGEVNFAFTTEVFDRTEAPYWLFDMDGILVPFFIETLRFKSSETALVKFEGLDSALKIKELCGKEVFYPIAFADDFQEEENEWAVYVGFNVTDLEAGYLGEITAVDDSTMNVLFALNKNDVELLMPFAEEFIKGIDLEKREMTVLLPEGLLDL